jgi:hypothetical protein
MLRAMRVRARANPNFESKPKFIRQNHGRQLADRHLTVPSCRFTVLELSDEERGVELETVLVFIGLALGICLAFFGDRLTRPSAEEQMNAPKAVFGHAGLSSPYERTSSVQ